MALGIGAVTLVAGILVPEPHRTCANLLIGAYYVAELGTWRRVLLIAIEYVTGRRLERGAFGAYLRPWPKRSRSEPGCSPSYFCSALSHRIYPCLS